MLIDVLYDPNDRSTEGLWLRHVALAFRRAGHRVIPATPYAHETLAGYEELASRGQDGVSELQVVLGLGALDHCHVRRGLPRVVVLERLHDLNAMRRNILLRSQLLVMHEDCELDVDVRWVPYCHDAEHAAIVRFRKVPDLVYTIGPWADVRPAVDFYVTGGHRKGRLAVVSADCPIRTAADWVRFAGPAVPPPSIISGDRARDLDERKAHAQGRVCYCDRNDHYRHVLARVYGSIVCTDDGDCPFDYLASGEGEPSHHESLDLGPWLAELEPRLVEVAEQARPRPVRAVHQDLHVAAIVPHLGRGLAYLRSAIGAAEAALGEHMDQVVVVQYAHDDLARDVALECVARDWTCVLLRGAGFNLSHARNVGARWVEKSTEPRQLLFLDCDVLLPEDYAIHASRLPAAELPAVVVPRVVDGNRFLEKHPGAVSGAVRGGTGIALIDQAMFASLGGFDETFVGRGNEDLDLLARAQARSGAEVLVTDCTAYHNPHSSGSVSAWADTESSPVGDPDRCDVNPDGWGGGGLVVVRRGQRTLDWDEVFE